MNEPTKPTKTFRKFILHTISSPLKPLEYLSKYAPKAHKTLACQISDLRTSKVTHKIKKLKVLQTLNIKDYSPECKAVVLKAFLPLKNHIKDINVTNPVLLRHFPRLRSFVLNVKSLSSWKTFFMLVNLEALTTEFVNDLIKCKAPKPIHPNISGYINTLFWFHLSKLAKLKHFSLHLYNQFNEQLFRFFSRLNSLESLLTSLKTLTLFFNHIEITFPHNFSFPNIYKSLTIFKAHESSLSSIQRLLISPEDFHNLEFISIIKTIQDFEEDFYPEGNPAYFDFFQGIGTLEKVKEIDIAINLSTESGFKSFLKRFSLPKSVKAVKLNLYETCWYSVAPKQTEEFFAENELFSGFYKEWTNLRCLENLSLCFSELEINTSPSLFFISPLLRRLTTLKELYYANWSNNMWENKKKTVDFQHLWSCLQHLRPSLKTLYLENPAISLRNFTEEPAMEGCGLEKLGFCGVVVGDKQLNYLRGMFGKNMKGDVEIERLLIDNEETLEEVLGDLLQIHKMVDFSINIDVRNIKAEVLVEIICKTVPRFQRENLVRLSFCNISLDVAKPSLVEKLKMTFNSGGSGGGNREEKGIRIYSEEGGILFTNRKRSLFGKMQKHASFMPPGIGQMANEEFNEVYSLDQSLSGDEDNGEFGSGDDDLFESDDMMDSDDEDNEEIIEDF